MAKGFSPRLRARFAATRVDEAERIAKLAFIGPFSGYTVENRTLAKKAGLYARRKVHILDRSDSESLANLGGFEIHGPSGHVATVDVVHRIWRDRSFGKPVIEVLKNHEDLAQAISLFLKRHGGYWFSPKVKVVRTLLPYKARFDATARKEALLAAEKKSLEK